jgi:preprotein translocase subunit SecF
MNNLPMRKFLIILFILSFGIGSCNAQIFHKGGSRNPEKGLFGKSLGNKKEVKVKEPRKVTKAKKKQEAKDKKLKKDSAKAVKRSQKRTIEIQTPEVQTRMKQNKKDSEIRDKTKKKKVNTGTKKAGRKYK